jgi:hypothetical protein
MSVSSGSTSTVDDDDSRALLSTFLEFGAKVRSIQSCRAGFSVDFYIRNILNTLVRFHPFFHVMLAVR